MITVPIDDPADPRLDGYRALNDPELRRDVEEAAGWCVVEGITAVAKLLTSPLDVVSVLTLTTKAGRVADLAGSTRHATVNLLVVDRTVMAETAGFDLHRGVVALARRPEPTPIEHVLNRRSIAVLEALNDHENLGAIGRAARALGVEALVLDDRCADPYYRRSIRVSMGELLRIPIVRVPTVARALAVLHGAGFTTWALTTDGEVAVEQAPTTNRTAVVLGAEGPGLTAASLSAAMHRVRIAIEPEVDSLNVAQAAAIAFHHVRQRRTG